MDGLQWYIMQAIYVELILAILWEICFATSEGSYMYMKFLAMHLAMHWTGCCEKMYDTVPAEYDQRKLFHFTSISRSINDVIFFT